MASSIQEAMKAFMATNQPNSGHRPPNLTVTEDTYRNCASCVDWNGENRCLRFGYNTQPDQVCDQWSPHP